MKESSSAHFTTINSLEVVDKRLRRLKVFGPSSPLDSLTSSLNIIKNSPKKS
jgi:hypothetical protein